MFIFIKTSSNLELYSEINESFESAAEEPEAVIVEVEDEGCELMPSASPQIQIPIFKFDFATKDLRLVFQCILCSHRVSKFFHLEAA